VVIAALYAGACGGTGSPSSSPSSSSSAGGDEKRSAAPNTIVSAGGLHTVGLRADGTAVAVGRNVVGSNTGWHEDGRCDVSEWKLATPPPSK